jgi:hypothetical protein
MEITTPSYLLALAPSAFPKGHDKSELLALVKHFYNWFLHVVFT